MYTRRSTVLGHQQAPNMLIEFHYSDVIMSAMAFQIIGVSIVCLTFFFRRWSEETSKLRVTGLCEGNPPVDSSQRASDAEKCFHLMTSSWLDLFSLKFLSHSMIPHQHWGPDEVILNGRRNLAKSRGSSIFKDSGYLGPLIQQTLVWVQLWVSSLHRRWVMQDSPPVSSYSRQQLHRSSMIYFTSLTWVYTMYFIGQISASRNTWIRYLLPISPILDEHLYQIFVNFDHKCFKNTAIIEIWEQSCVVTKLF